MSNLKKENEKSKKHVEELTTENKKLSRKTIVLG